MRINPIANIKPFPSITSFSVLHLIANYEIRRIEINYKILKGRKISEQVTASFMFMIFIVDSKSMSRRVNLVNKKCSNKVPTDNFGPRHPGP